MNRLLKKTVFCTMCALLFLAGESFAQQKPFQLKVLSMNLRLGGKLAGYKAKPYADFIREQNPDVVMFQEVNRFDPTQGNNDLLMEIAAELKMFPYFSKSIPNHGGDYGVAVLSRYPFFNAGRILSKPQGVREARSLGYVYVQLPDGNVVRVGSVHLAVESPEHGRQNMQDYMKELNLDKETPMVIAGDFNSDSWDAAITYSKHFWDIMGGEVFSFPVDQPKRKLDYVMALPKNRWTCEKYEVIARKDLSDHCFVCAEVSFK